MDNIQTLLSHFYRTTKIPLTLFNNKNNTIVGFPSTIPNFQLFENGKKEHINIFQTNSHAFYCTIHLKDSSVLLVGPVFNTPMTKKLVQIIMIEHSFKLNYFDDISNVLFSSPHLSYTKFFNYISFLYYLIFGEDLSIISSFFHEIAEIKETEKKLVKEMIESKEDNSYHNSYYWERKLYSCIQNGNIPQLMEVLKQQVDDSITEGIMADSPLRQAKNIFIGTVTKIGMLAAIPGGMNIEETYSLIDTYSRECESLNSIESVNNLHYRMTLDFCKRINDNRLPNNISSDIYEAICFIHNNTNEVITLEDVSDHIHRSKSFIITHFKKEMGMTPNAYIIKSKLEEAKRLLKYTNNSLTDISYYLCFSSQSYFQNVFKKHFGITPMQYRKKSS